MAEVASAIYVVLGVDQESLIIKAGAWIMFVTTGLAKNMCLHNDPNLQRNTPLGNARKHVKTLSSPPSIRVSTD